MEIDRSEQLRASLEAIKESIVGFKFAIDNLQDRADKVESEIANLRVKTHDLSSNTIRTDERIATIQKYLDTMSADVRTVRNAVIGAVVTALIIGVVTLAIGNYRQSHPIQTTVRQT